MKKPYFQHREGDPPPLRIKVERRVRFEEVDVVGIVWHGRYSSYFEDARTALGEAYGVGYMDCYENGVLAPIKQMYVDYRRPLRFQEYFSIEALLHWSEAARMNYEFIVRNPSGVVLARGYTIQIMLDRDYKLLLTSPPFYLRFLERWRAGELK